MRLIIVISLFSLGVNLTLGCISQKDSILESSKIIANEELSGFPEINNESKSDPLITMAIHPAKISGKNGGRFGCSRSCSATVKKPHRGLDLKAKVNTELTPIYSGKVVKVDQSSQFGKFIVLQSTLNGDNFFQMYLHLNQTNVKVGDLVNQSTKIGKTGGTGKHAKGSNAHLHVELGYGNNYNDFRQGDNRNKRYDPEDHISTTFGNNSASHVSNCSPCECC